MSDQSAKRALYEQMLETCKVPLRFLALSGASRDDAADLEEDIRLELWRRLDLFEGRSSCKTWFCRVASNVILARQRDAGRRVREADLSAVPEPTTYRGGDNRSPYAILAEFVGSPLRIDGLVFLMYLDGVTYGELAESTQTDEATIRVRVSRIRKRYESRYIGS